MPSIYTMEFHVAIYILKRNEDVLYLQIFKDLQIILVGERKMQKNVCTKEGHKNIYFPYICM